jgi:hypothetical protein
MKFWILGSCLSLVGVGALISHRLISASIPADREQFFADQLEKAQSTSEPDQALHLIEGIPTNSQHFADAKRLEQSLMPQVIDSAKSLSQQGNFASAIAMIKSIPASETGLQESQALAQEWTRDLQQISTVQQMIADHRSTAAIAQIKQLRSEALFNNPAMQDLLIEAKSLSGSTLVSDTAPAVSIDSGSSQLSDR